MDDVEHVTEVQKTHRYGISGLQQRGLMKQSEQQSNMIQAVLGGIGAVSLFVAAIGIANTMMMSIYKRTKEIGIIKVLGSDMKVIRNMFLLESGFIGFMGGVVGLIFSEGVSFHQPLAKHRPAMTGMNGTFPEFRCGWRRHRWLLPCSLAWPPDFPGPAGHEVKSAGSNPQLVTAV